MWVHEHTRAYSTTTYTCEQDNHLFTPNKFHPFCPFHLTIFYYFSIYFNALFFFNHFKNSEYNIYFRLERYYLHIILALALKMLEFRIANRQDEFVQIVVSQYYKRVVN